MKLRIFQSDKGDCLLLEAKDGTRMLCDGGMTTSMQETVRHELAKLRRQNIKLDRVYISHIDQDHIAGIVQLLSDEIEWRLYDHHKAKGTPKPRPKVPRPPEIDGIWHNAFRDQVGDNADAVEDLLAAAAPSLLASGSAEGVQTGIEYQQIAQSIGEAITVSRYASPELLGIPTNVLPGANGPAKLLMYRQGQPAFQLGSLSLTIIGPGSRELEDLKKGWNNWLNSSESEATLTKLRKQIKDKIDDFANVALWDQAWNGIPSYKGVTPPNVASLMFMVEEDGKRVLLTGDSQQDKILTGLKSAGFLGNAGIHLDVLKVQHHGSEHNLDANFAKHVSADHYIFCGNGSDGNPELKVIDHIYQSRLGKPSLRALASSADGRPFTFWFSTTSDAQIPGSKQKKTFQAVEAHVANLKASAGGKLKVKFNSRASVTLTV